MKQLLIFCLAAALSGCGAQEAANQSQNGKPLFLASFYPVYIAAKNIVGDADVGLANMAGQQAGCLHDYQLKPADLAAAEQADIFIANGAGMEAFMEKILAARPDLPVVDASAGFPLAYSETSHTHSDGKLHAERAANPHIWVSLSGAIWQTQKIAERLMELDAKNAALYQENAALYIGKLEALQKEMQSALADRKRNDIITFHEAFPYFAQEFGFNVLGVIERDPGTEPTAKELEETVNLVRQAGGAALFAEPQYPKGAAEIIARETGSPLYVLDPAALGPDDKDAYINIMRANLKTLLAALN